MNSLGSTPRWTYTRAEILADGVVHLLGVIFGLVGFATLTLLSFERMTGWRLTSVLVYASALLAVLTISAVYNLWPVSAAKWILRRFDHSAIYLLIAGTYTPFVAQTKGNGPLVLLTVVWLLSLVGIFLKLRFPGRFDRFSIGLYLLIGWSGVLAYDTFAGLSASTLALLSLGGILYTVGVIFHLWRDLPFHNAVWHAFVLVAACCHYAAVLDGVVLIEA
jgi:hemolysin III